MLSLKEQLAKKQLKQQLKAEKNEQLLISYTHTLGNTLFPENLLSIIETLKQNNPELRKEILQLYGIYHAETTIRQQGDLLRIRYMTNNPDEFLMLIKKGCLTADSKESGISLMTVFERALENMVARFLNLDYAKLQLARNCLELDWKALKENFEQQIYFEHQNILEWTNQHLMNIELIFETEKWQQVRFKPQEHAEALFFEYFNELLLNTFKYADFKQGLQIRFYMQPIENINYLYCEWQNTSRQNITSGSQINLEHLMIDLSQLNQSATPETTVQIVNENDLFKITLAFKKDLILFEFSQKDRERIARNINRWLAEKEEKESAHLVD